MKKRKGELNPSFRPEIVVASRRPSRLAVVAAASSVVVPLLVWPVLAVVACHQLAAVEKVVRRS